MARSRHWLREATFLPTDVIPGTPNDDTLTGTSGADTINGGLGADLMQGGLGNDSYVIDNAGDRIVEAAGAGLDSVLSRISHTLADNVERLQLAGSAHLSGTGNALDNVLIGNAGNNRLSGGDGRDSISGDAGHDTLNGDAGDDTLDGGAGVNQMSAGDGDDVLLNSGSGTLYGGAGQDHLIFVDGRVGPAGYAYAGDGNDTIDAQLLADVSYLLVGDAGDDVIHCTGSEEAALSGGDGNDSVSGWGDYLNGGFGDDTLRSESGPSGDRLDGYGGKDLAFGSAYDDSFIDYDTDADTYIAGEGADRLSVQWRTISDDVNWTFTFDSHVVQGNTYAGFEKLEAETGSGNDYIDASAALYSALRGGAGNDTLIGSAGEFQAAIYGYDGNDDLRASGSGSAWLEGNDGKDTLTGGAAEDVLNGGAGKDRLSGGDGDDTFKFASSIKDPDTILDFGTLDNIAVDQKRVYVGDGDRNEDGAVMIDGPGSFSATAELVIVTSDIAGALTADNAAAAIGSSSVAYATGRTAIFAVDNGVDSAVYYFESSGNDALVSATELTLMATLSGTASTTIDNYNWYR